VFAAVELTDDVRRVTFPLPHPPGHVHGYLLRGDDGWTLVDTGLAVPGYEERLAGLVATLEAPVVRIAVTHFHPDHVGGAGPAAAATGARVHQGARDYAQCEQVWGDERWPSVVADWFGAHGVPAAITDELRRQGPAYGAFIRFARDPEPLEEGGRVGGWEVVELPGHADGHVCLLREGRLVAGDHLLPGISPAVGLYPESRPDPLGDYLRSLARTVELAPRLVYPGHGDPIADPVGRARELIEHHRRRLEATEAALASGPRTAYEASLTLFGEGLASTARRFAVAETLAHLEHLVVAGRARRDRVGGSFSYTAT
jgi:glyoxylase-like metal-dependent hydrolase (beta-lactamase superfamily II)